MEKEKIKLTIPKDQVFTHAEFAVREDVTRNGRTIEQTQTTDDQGNYKFTAQFKNGDVIKVSPETAAHLVASGQGERVK